MKAAAYITHSEYSFQNLNYDTMLDDALFLSTVKMEHSQILKLGLDKCHAWMQKNPDLTHVINVRSSDRFD